MNTTQPLPTNVSIACRDCFVEAKHLVKIGDKNVPMCSRHAEIEAERNGERVR